MSRHYETLGVDRGASVEDIRKAYRRKAQAAHPDKKGGSAEAFHPIQRAYEVLTDAERRARYDASGDDAPRDTDPRIAALQEIARIILAAVDQLDVDRVDIVASARDAVRNAQQQLEKTRTSILQASHRRGRALNRLTRKGQGEDLVAEIIRNSIRELDARLAQVRIEAGRHELILEILQDYQYAVDAGAPVFMNIFTTSSTGGFR